MNAYFRFLTVAITTLIFHTSANALFWSEWKESDNIKELPYANGKIVVSKYRTKSCIMCTSGHYTEEAFFSGNKKYYTKDLTESIETLFSQFIPKNEWTYMGKSFVGGDRYFYPIRMFVVSIDPLVIVTIPWQYKTNPKDVFAAHDIYNEGEKFSEQEYYGDNHSQVRRIEQSWYGDLRVAKEIRGTLPAEAINVHVIIDRFQNSLNITTQANESNILEIGAQIIQFIRLSDGKVSITFLK